MTWKVSIYLDAPVGLVCIHGTGIGSSASIDRGEILQKGDWAALVAQLESDEVGMDTGWWAASSTAPEAFGFRVALRVGEEGEGGGRREGREESVARRKGRGCRWGGGGRRVVDGGWWMWMVDVMAPDSRA